MPFTEALRLLIDADTGGAVRGIQKVGQVTDRELGRSQKRLDAWSKGLTTAGAGMVAFGAAGLFGLGKAAQASEEANLAVVKLENTLGNMPKLAGENSKQFIDLADAIQGKTAADADAIIEAEALLGTFRLTATEIKKITPLVVDYSRKFGVDLPSAATQVGKALDGNIGALKRVGISIDETAFAADRFGAVQSALRDQVGGFAEAEGKTFSGSLERLKNQLGDVAEGVGAGAVDAFSDLFGVIGGGLDKIKDLSPAAQQAIGKFATFGSVALIAAGGLSFTIGQVIKMRENFAALGSAIDAARLRFASLSGVIGPLGIGAALLAAGTGFAFYLKQQNEAKIAAAAEAFAKLRDVTRESAAETLKLNDAVKVSTTDFTASASAADEFRSSGELTNQVMRDLDEHFNQIIDKNPALAQGFIDNARELGVSADKLREWQGELDGKISKDAEAVNAQDAYNQAVQEAAGVTDEATSALQEYLDTLNAMFDPLFGATDALMDNQQAQQAVKAAELELVAAQREHGASSAEAAAAQQELTAAQLAAGKSALDVKQATAELSAAVKDGTVSVATAKDMLASWVGQGLISQSTAAALARAFDSTADSADTLGATDPTVTVSEKGNRAVQGQLGRTKDAVFNVPTSRTTNMSAKDNASNIIRSVQRLISGTPTLHTTTMDVVTVFRQINAGDRPGGRQHGGPVRAGEAYIVGEQRPEVFVPDRDGHILPSIHSLPHMGAGAGAGGTTINVSISGIVASDGRELERVVVKAIRSAGEHGRPITVRGRRL